MDIEIIGHNICDVTYIQNTDTVTNGAKKYFILFINVLNYWLKLDVSY